MADLDQGAEREERAGGPSALPPAARRTTGLLLALALTLIGAGVVMFVAVANHSAPKASPLPGNVVDIGKAPPPVGPGDSPLKGGVNGRLQFEDKKEPGRLAAELGYERLDPVGAGYYTLDGPRGWVYLKDGRTLYIRADSGRIKLPKGQSQPESGDFRGHVVAKLFAAPPAGTLVQSIDPDRTAPTVVGVTDSLSFDGELLELRTQDPIAVASRNLLFEGEGLVVRANQVRERVEYLLTKGRSVRFNPHGEPDKGGKGKGGKAGPAAPAHDATAAAAPAVAGGSAGGAGGAGRSDAAAAPAPAGGVATVAPAAPTPREQLYKTVVSDDVAVFQRGRRLNADVLEVFARLIDGKLPEDAFGAWASAGKGEKAVTGASTEVPAKPEAAEHPVEGTVATVGGAGPSASPASSSTPAAPAPSPTTSLPAEVQSLFVSSGEDDVVMTWAGALVMTPMNEAQPPAELSGGNHFAARFRADKLGGQPCVVLTDAQTHATAVCAQLEYAATLRRLALLSGPEMPAVVADLPGVGRFMVPSATADLGTGVAMTTGGGLLASLKDAGPPVLPGAAPPAPADPDAPLPLDTVRQITWSDQGDFKFRTDGGRITDALESAAFAGKVVARDRASLIAADYLRAEFGERGKVRTLLERLHADGNVVAVQGERRPASAALAAMASGPVADPFHASDRLDVTFRPVKEGSSEVEPALAVAVGHVRAATRDASLRAEKIETAFGRDGAGKLAATEVLATGGVLFERSDGVTARSEVLRARPVARTADLTGEPVAIGKGPSTILGRQFQLSDAEGTLLGFGPGSLEHLQAPEAGASGPGAGPTRVTATWTRSVAFNNLRGTVEADGEAVVTSVAPLETSVAKGERLRLWLTPGGETDAKAAQAAQTPPGSGEAALGGRRVLKAEVLGSVLERAGGENAKIEVRRYAAPALPAAPAGSPPPERWMDQLVYLEGPTITADDVVGTLTVPAAGRAIVRDQKQAAGAPAQPASTPAAGAAPQPGAKPPKATTTRGTTQFTWAESLVYTRSTGLLRMTKDARLVHLALGAKGTTTVTAERMDATIGPAPGSRPEGDKGKAMDLLSAEAVGAVVAESGPQTMMADHLKYDAATGVAKASSLPGNRVTLYDDRRGAPTVSRGLLWDLVHDRVEVTEPEPISAPR
jgi:lipopolysaccharide export system protein LptA